jgi:competence protein ComEC
LKQVYTLITVSIAAQLATLPVSLYYFHQFPNYFLLSNLVVIPLSTGIIYMGMLLILISGNAWLLNYVSLFFSKTITLLNAAVMYIRDLPYAVTDNISMDAMEVCLMYVFIVYIFLYFHKKKYDYLKMSLCLLIVGLSMQVIKQAKQRQQKKIIVYAIPKMSAVDFISAQEHVLLTDTSYQEKTGINYMKQNWCNLGLQAPLIASKCMKTGTVFIKDEAIQFYTRRLIILRENGKIKELQQQGKSMAVDYVVISGNVNVKIEAVKAVYKPGCIVFDLTNSSYRLKKWEKECLVLHQRYYSVADSGAYIAEL